MAVDPQTERYGDHPQGSLTFGAELLKHKQDNQQIDVSKQEGARAE